MANTSVGYTCPNCGGPLSFSPGAARVTCPYCDTEFETAKIEEIFAKQEKMAAEAQAAKEAKWHTEGAGGEWRRGSSCHEGIYLLFLRRGNRQ